MKNKGFTLVELLGVIVVLAIIALIAVPTVIGVVDKARKNSLRNSGYGLVEAGTLYYAEKQNTKTVRFDIKDNEVTTKAKEKLIYKGNIKEGTILINKRGKVVICINDGKYAAYKNFEDNKVTLVEGKTCTIPENSSIVYLDNEATENNCCENNLLKIEELENKIKILEQQVGQTDLISLVNNLKNQHTSDISSINLRLESIINNIANKADSSEIEELKEEIASLRKSIPNVMDLTNTVNNLKSQHTGDITKINNSINSIKGDMSSINLRLETITNNISTKADSNEVNELKEKIKTLESNSSNSEILAMIESMNQEINNLKTNQTNLTNKNNTLTTEVAALKKSSTTLDKVYPVGSIYISTSNVNPSSLFGGTWEKYASGRTLIGEGTGMDSNRTSNAFTLGATGGEYSHKLTVPEMPSHNHSKTFGAANIYYSYGTENLVLFRDNGQAATYNYTSTNAGGDQYHNNIQPYIVVSIWKRVS